jgi:hypothetical protein
MVDPKEVEVCIHVSYRDSKSQPEPAAAHALSRPHAVHPGQPHSRRVRTDWLGGLFAGGLLILIGFYVAYVSDCGSTPHPPGRNYLDVFMSGLCKAVGPVHTGALIGLLGFLVIAHGLVRRRPSPDPSS